MINNISVGGWFPTPYAAAYTASKFGLRGFGEALQAELHSHPRIHVYNLYPAFLDTPGLQHAANFTGKALKPAPPVYDPQLVARTIARLVRHPRKTTTVGAASTLLRIAHAIAPGISGWATATVMEKYFKVADASYPSTGNVMGPVPYGTSIHGGWSASPQTKTRAFAALGVAAVVGGLLLLNKHRD